MSKMFVSSSVYKPFHYSWAVDITVEHERMHWHEAEIDLADDVGDWKLGRLAPAEKNFVTQILRMFTASDVNVGSFYLDYLIPRFRNNEIRNMLSSFATREGTHQRAYALLNDTLGLPDGDYAAFLEYKQMSDKHEFMLKADPSTDEGLALAMAKSVFNEGVSLFASFVMLLNFQRRGLMKGMGKVVEWSIKDESKHVQGMARLFRAFADEHPHVVTDPFKKAIYDLARQIVELEDRFVDLAYEMGTVSGLAADEVKRYIRFIADRRLVQLGMKENFFVGENPLAWVDVLVNAPDLTNFFENKVAEYELGSLTGEWDYSAAEMRVYGRDGCPYCVKAKELLASRGISFHYVDLTDDEARQAFYDERGLHGPARTVPQIYSLEMGEEVLIGGYSDLFRKLNEDAPTQHVDCSGYCEF